MSSAVRVLMSPELQDSIRAWLTGRSARDPEPTDETAHMLVAMFRRGVRVGLTAITTVENGSRFVCDQ